MRKRILIINENVVESTNIKERLVSAYNDAECVTSIHNAVNTNYSSKVKNYIVAPFPQL